MIAEEPVNIFIDKNCIVFKFPNGHEYDPDLRDTKQEWWIEHMRGKNWFTKNVENKTLEILKSL